MTLARETREMAKRLLDFETAALDTTAPTESVVVRVCEKLRQPLSAIVGLADYRSLLSRALILAKREAPALGAVQVATDGSLQGLREVCATADENHTGEEGVVLIGQLLGLFLAFLGEALTLQLVREVSPHLEVIKESASAIPCDQILQEVVQLNQIGSRLESLAGEHTLLEGALMSISGNIRNISTTLEILALIKNNSAGPAKNVLKPHSRRRFGSNVM